MMRIIFLQLLLVLVKCSHRDSFVVINARNWVYKGRHNVNYDEAYCLPFHSNSPNDNNKNISSANVVHADDGSYDENDNNDKDAILLLNGFGVGTFHQHRLVEQLLNEDNGLRRNFIIYCVDYIGQGKSWPIDCNDGISDNENGFIYSGDTWLEQVIQFIEQVILSKGKHQNSGSQKSSTKKVHVIGNSVGGHLAVYLATCRPDLVESICLLNSTPIWGLNLPGWSGHLPAPPFPKWIGRYLFDRIRDKKTLLKGLKLTYVNEEAYENGAISLVNQMHACTTGKGGHAAFASILWSPPLSGLGEEPLSYYDCLRLVSCDVLLVFGKDDPLCRPAFAKKMLRFLSSRKMCTGAGESERIHRYVELTNVGHCPNHEAPNAVAKLVCPWIKSNNRSQENLTLVKNKKEVVRENWGEVSMEELHENDVETNFLERMAMALFA